MEQANSVESAADAGDTCLLGEHCPCGPLPPRQRQTFHRVLSGESERQIAQAIGINGHTVHTYVAAIYKSFGVSGKVELLAKFLKVAAREARARKKYSVILTEADRRTLLDVIASDGQPARRIAHARTLLLADKGETDESISALTEVSVRTVERIARRFSGSASSSVTMPASMASGNGCGNVVLKSHGKC